MFEGGSECSEKVLVKVESFYFDHIMFYQNKNSLYFALEFNEKRFYDVDYYVADMRERATELTGEGGEAD